MGRAPKHLKDTICTTGDSTLDRIQAMKKTASLAKTTSLVSVITLASRIFGMLRDTVVASYFGAGYISDAFYLAFTIPNLLRRLVAEGTLSPAFVPVFTDKLNESDNEAKKAIAATTSFSLLLTTSLTFLGIWFAPELTDLFAPGFRQNPDQFALAVILTQIMMPYIITVSLLAIAGGAQNTLGYFGLSAASQVIMNFVMIIGVPFSTKFTSEPIYGVAWSVPISGLISLIPNLFLLKRLGFPMSLGNPFNSPAVKKICMLMIPAILAASVYQLMVLVNRMLASMLPNGSITWYYYADRLVQFPLGVFTVALSTAILPKLSKLSSINDDIEFNRQLSNGLSWISYVTVPATAGLCMLSKPIDEAIYRYGQFGANDSLQTSNSLIAFSIGLWAISAHSLVVRAYFARKNTLLPSIVSICALSMNSLLAICFMGAPSIFQESTIGKLIIAIQQHAGLLSLGHVGLALAGSTGAFISFISLSFCLRYIRVHPKWLSFTKDTVQCIIASSVMSVFLVWVASLNLPAILTLLIAIPLGALIYQGSSYLIGNQQAKESSKIILQRFPFTAKK